MLGVSEISFMLRLWAWSVSENQHMFIHRMCDDRQTAQQPLQNVELFRLDLLFRGFPSEIRWSQQQRGCSQCPLTLHQHLVWGGLLFDDPFPSFFLFCFLFLKADFFLTNKIKEKNIPHQSASPPPRPPENSFIICCVNLRNRFSNGAHSGTQNLLSKLVLCSVVSCSVIKPVWVLKVMQ